MFTCVLIKLIDDEIKVLTFWSLILGFETFKHAVLYSKPKVVLFSYTNISKIKSFVFYLFTFIWLTLCENKCIACNTIVRVLKRDLQ